MGLSVYLKEKTMQRYERYIEKLPCVSFVLLFWFPGFDLTVEYLLLLCITHILCFGTDLVICF